MMLFNLARRTKILQIGLRRGINFQFRNSQKENHQKNWKGNKKITSPYVSIYEKDDLYFNHEIEEDAFKKVIRKLRSNPISEISQKSVGFILYNMAQKELKDDVVFDQLFTQIHLTAGKYMRIFAFGALYGALRLSLERKHINFFKEQFDTEGPLLWTRYVEIVEAINYNQNLSLEDKHIIIGELIEPYFAKTFRKNLMRNTPQNLKLITGLYKAGYYHTELFERCISLALNDSSIANNNIISVWEILNNLRDKGVAIVNFDKHFEKTSSLMDTRRDIVWTYNKEERRYRSYIEMIERRDLNLYPDEINDFGFLPKHIADIRERMNRKEGEEEGDVEINAAAEFDDSDILDLMNKGGIKSNLVTEDEDFIDEGNDEDDNEDDE